MTKRIKVSRSKDSASGDSSSQTSTGSRKKPAESHGAKMRELEARIRKENLAALRGFARVQAALFRWREKFPNHECCATYTDSISALMDLTMQDLGKDD